MKPALIIALILSWVLFLSTGWPTLAPSNDPNAVEVSVSSVDEQMLEQKVAKLEKELKDAEKVIENLTQLEGQISLLENEQDRLKAEAQVQSQMTKELASELASREQDLQTKEKVIDVTEDHSEEDEAEKSDNPMAAMMKEMMKAEGMEEMVKMQVEQQFTRLWSDFAPDMTPELRDVVLEKLKARQMEQAMEGMKFFQMEGDERDEWAQKLKEDNESFNSDIETLLGLEYAPLYQDYQETLPARQQFMAFKQLGYAPQNPETEGKVLDAFIAAQKTVSSHTPEEMPESFDGEALHQHSNKVLDHQKLLIQEVLVQTQESLSNKEHQELSGRLQQYQKQMEIGLKMSKMFMSDAEEDHEEVIIETEIIEEVEVTEP